MFLTKKFKKNLFSFSRLTLHSFYFERSRELFSKKNQKRTLVNILNKKIKKNLFPFLNLPCIHFVLKGLESHFLKKTQKNYSFSRTFGRFQLYFIATSLSIVVVEIPANVAMFGSALTLRRIKKITTPTKLAEA